MRNVKNEIEFKRFSNLIRLSAIDDSCTLKEENKKIRNL